VVRELDATASPLAFLGAELRRARSAAGLSQEQLGQRIGYSGTLIGKVETGERAPSEDLIARCDGALDTGGLLPRLYALAHRWDGGGHPAWFAEWVEIERRAASLCWWEPLVIPGLLQTPDYARAILAGGPDTTEDELEEMVGARIERQAILDRPEPPALLVVLDDAVLHRLVGSPKIMYGQLLRLAELSARPRVTVQMVPARTGVHAGLLGGFAIATVDGRSIIYLETSANGQVSDKASVVAQVTRRLDALRAVALPTDDSQEMMLKVAEERWAAT
jgi:transcriptional regulator with XRE-family HTH domain